MLTHSHYLWKILFCYPCSLCWSTDCIKALISANLKLNGFSLIQFVDLISAVPILTAYLAPIPYTQFPLTSAQNMLGNKNRTDTETAGCTENNVPYSNEGNKQSLQWNSLQSKMQKQLFFLNWADLFNDFQQLIVYCLPDESGGINP